MHLIVYGPEGSGKGTQAKLLSDKTGLPVITSGDLVRQHAKENDELGRVCLEALEKGRYVPDEFMFRLWRDKLVSPQSRKGFILDGFPRNVNQAVFLSDVLNKLDYSIDWLIYIKISDEEAYRRLSKRARKLFDGSEESHDTPEKIKGRLGVYHQAEKEMVEYFRNLGKLKLIDGEKTVAEVFAEICGSLNLKV